MQQTRDTQAVGEEIERLLDFFALAERLKVELRHSWLSNGRQESVAEHCWMMALMAVLLHRRLERPVDLARVLKMIVVHDIGETIIGDIPFFEVSARKDAKADAEARAMERIRAALPADVGGEVVDLWREFEGGATDAARFARALDHLEVQVQHNHADLKTWLPLEHDLVYTKMDRPCAHDPFLAALARAVRARAEAKIERGGGDVEALRARHR